MLARTHAASTSFSLLLLFLIKKSEIKNKKKKKRKNCLVQLNTNWSLGTYNCSTVNGDSDPGSVLAMRQFLLIKSTMRRGDSINFKED